MQEELEEIRKENNANLVEIERQRKIISKLERSNSTNSNMPSSNDILSHTVPKERKHINSRKKSGMKRGGQTGHTAHISPLSSADTVEEIRVKKAPEGAETVRDNKGNVLYYRTQEIDFVMRGKVREVRYYIDCENGEELSAEIMKKIDVKESSISKWEKEFLRSGEKKQEEILSEIKEGKVVHVDETSVKVKTDQYWLHTISNERGIFYTVTENRCDRENVPLNKLKDYPNVLVHDHLKSYYTLTGCLHAECNARIQRYLQSGIDF